MPELIDKQATLKKMCESCGYCERFEKAMRTTHPDFVSDKCNVYKFLAEQPTIEPEVRHGRWTRKGCVKKPEYDRTTDLNAYAHRCSACDQVSYFPIDFKDIFCRRCGAKMDGGDDNG